MRLIDADALQKYLREEYHGMISDESMKIYEVLRLIDAQQTAYDTEKVVAELEERKGTYFDGVRCEGTMIKINDAIEIVRKGGGAE